MKNPRKNIRAVLFLALSSFLVLSSLTLQAQTPTTPVQASGGASSQAAGQAKIDSAKEADIRKLLDITGVATIAAQTTDGMFKNMRPLLARSLPPGDYRDKLIDLFFERFREKANPQKILDLVVPIYDKHLSHEDVKALIAFYETPLGKKTISVLPMIALESREAGEKWGEALGSDCMTEVLAEHPDLKTALEAAGKAAR